MVCERRADSIPELAEESNEMIFKIFPRAPWEIKSIFGYEKPYFGLKKNFFDSLKFFFENQRPWVKFSALFTSDKYNFTSPMFILKNLIDKRISQKYLILAEISNLGSNFNFPSLYLPNLTIERL